MLIALVFFVIIAAIGLTVYGSSAIYDPICYIEEGEPECDASKNVICLYCFGLVELNCGCPLMPLGRGYKWCKCAEPQRSDDPSRGY
jgi:hypothetical protein